MDLSDLFAGANAQVREKEAEAMEILARSAGPARRALDAAKRAYGNIPVRGLGVFVNLEDEASYNRGKREASRFLFEAYATIVFPQVSDAEAFIALLGAISERVGATLGPTDRHELDLCRLEWEKRAWGQLRASEPKPTAFSTGSRKVRSLWDALWRETARRADWDAARERRDDPVLPPATAADRPTAVGPEVTPIAPEANAAETTDRRLMIDAFLRRCNGEPGLKEKIIRKHIWLAVGHTKARQFEYWQARDSKATTGDDRNFGRILSTDPATFVSELRKKGVIPASKTD